MKSEKVTRQRDALARAIGQPGEIVRGSLLHRTIRHKRGCQTCARGDGHPVWVLSINYPGGRNKQISIRPDALARFQQGDTAGAIGLSQESLELARVALRPGHPQLAHRTEDHARLLKFAGKDAEAAALFHRVDIKALKK